ncbi:hypothetical protein [Bosea sp. BK604]|uniref:hypothetical protein n=1 Tax=Bosea sp. BK604 TaxID=2512180 RepID=UPI00104C4CCB|nr:hypothetical protein [Bosea sp. BK604]TCR62258.1 hypothetical protein EV560_111249 [Bosea sp. BK604]
MRDGFGRKLTDEEAARITGKPAKTDATGHQAKPHVRPHKAGVADPAAPSDVGKAASGNGPGRDREIIDEP